MSLDKGGNCWHCGTGLAVFYYGRGDSCPQCGRDTRVCKGCVFFDVSYNNQCREPQADRVVEKERSNFCDYFKPSDQSGKGRAGSGAISEKDALKAAAEALFKKR